MLCSDTWLSYLQIVGSFWNCFNILLSRTRKVSSLSLNFPYDWGNNLLTIVPMLTYCGIFLNTSGPVWAHGCPPCSFVGVFLLLCSALALGELVPWICWLVLSWSPGWLSPLCRLPCSSSSLGLPSVSPVPPICQPLASVQSPFPCFALRAPAQRWTGR